MSQCDRGKAIPDAPEDVVTHGPQRQDVEALEAEDGGTRKRRAVIYLKTSKELILKAQAMMMEAARLLSEADALDEEL